MTPTLQRHPLRSSFLLASLAGLLFPALTIALLLWRENLGATWTNLVAIHRDNVALYTIWSAPAVLGIFGYILGKTSLLLKQKMDRLTRQTTELNTILDTAASAIITIDTQGIITNTNKAAENIFGYHRDELIGKNVNCLMPEAVAVEHDAYLQRYLDTRQASILGKRREVEARRKDGKTFPALLRVNPMYMDDTIYFSGVIDDISDTKTLHNQLIQAQKLEAIGQLASGVAHEINTPIQYIGDNLAALNQYVADLLAYQQGINRLIPDDLKPQLKKLAEDHDLAFILEDSPNAIRQSMEGVERVAEIVKAMKAFSHMEPAQGRQAIHLHEALNSALTISRNGYKYIAKVETDYADDIDLIECHANQLNQVFLNLIVNAAHAIEESRTDRGLIRIATRKRGDQVEIQIQDNGVGIPKPIQDKVFNLFFTTKPVGKGTGQGLSLAHSIIVEKHRGQLFFESEVGVGTTFYIVLPLYPA